MKNDNNKSVSNKVLSTIEKKGIEPKPKWHFLIKEWFVWLVVLFALLLGSIATALTVYIANASRFMIKHIQFSDLNAIFTIIPFLWILLFIIGVFYTVYAIHSTKNGYKWNSYWLVCVAIGVSILFGISTYVYGIGGIIDNYLLKEAPFYKSLTSYHEKYWMNSDEGIVVGIVTEIFEDNIFKIQKMDGEYLEIIVVPETHLQIKNELSEGMHLRIVGTITEKKFQADEITTFHGRGCVMQHGKMHVFKK